MPERRHLSCRFALGIAITLAALAAVGSSARAATILVLKPGQRLALDNGATVVARAAGSSEIFGVIHRNETHWFAAGSKLVRDARGRIFVHLNGRDQLLGVARSPASQRYFPGNSVPSVSLNQPKPRGKSPTKVSLVRPGLNAVAPGLKGLNKLHQSTNHPPRLGRTTATTAAPNRAHRVIAPTNLAGPNRVIAPTNLAGPNRVIAPTNLAGPHPLRINERGPRVADLQTMLLRLLDKGALIHPGQANRAKLSRELKREHARQYYGSATRDLVKLFQQAHGLRPTGQVNGATALKLNAAIARTQFPGNN